MMKRRDFLKYLSSLPLVGSLSLVGDSGACEGQREGDWSFLPVNEGYHVGKNIPYDTSIHSAFDKEGYLVGFYWNNKTTRPESRSGTRPATAEEICNLALMKIGEEPVKKWI